MNKFLESLKNKKLFPIIFVIFISIGFYMILQEFESVKIFFSGVYNVILPVLWGIVLAYLINPLSELLKRTILNRIKNVKFSHALSVVFAFLIILATLVLLFLMIIPKLVESAKVLVDNASYYFDSFRETLATLNNKIPFIEIDVEKIIGSSSEIFDKVSNWLMANVQHILDASLKFGGTLTDIFLSLMVSVYVLLDKENLFKTTKRFFHAMLKSKTESKFFMILNRSNKIFISFIVSNLLDALLVGVVNFMFMVLFDMPYPLLVSVIVGVFNFIPTFGPFIGAVPAFLIIVIVEPMTAVWFALWTLCLQLIDGNVVKPLLFGDTTGLRPVWVLISILIGGRLFGIIGMIVGVPLCAIISTILSDYLTQKLRDKGADEDINDIVLDDDRLKNKQEKLKRLVRKREE